MIKVFCPLCKTNRRFSTPDLLAFHIEKEHTEEEAQKQIKKWNTPTHNQTNS